MGFISWAIDVAWRILAIVAVVMLAKAIVRNGPEAIREFLDTIGMALRALGCAIRKACLKYIIKEKEKGKEEPKEEEKPPENEEKRYEFTRSELDEFVKAVKDDKPFILR